MHLSERERNTIIDCFRKIDDEINYGGDRHSNTIIASAIELFLNYCLRFYDRQFITRKKVNRDLLTRFEELIDDYFSSGKAQIHGTPTVAWCASELCLSPNYFGDLIKKGNRPLGIGLYPAKDDGSGKKSAYAARQTHRRNCLSHRLSVSTVFQPRLQESRRLHSPRLPPSGLFLVSRRSRSHYFIPYYNGGSARGIHLRNPGRHL